MKVKVTINVEKRSSDRVTANMLRKQDKLRIAIQDSVQQASTNIFETAQTNVPVQTGALRSSGKVTTTSQEPDVAEATISYGDSSLGIQNKTTFEYAPKRHETLTAAKPEAYKWLERALLEADEEFKKEAVRLIEKALRSR